MVQWEMEFYRNKQPGRQTQIGYVRRLFAVNRSERRLGMNDFYLVSVTFFSNSIRKNLPLTSDVETRYSPHLVIKGEEQYLGVTARGTICEWDKEHDIVVEAIYEGVGYYKLVEGAEFWIMEGPHIVGEGIVKASDAKDPKKGERLNNEKTDTNTDKKRIRTSVRKGISG